MSQNAAALLTVTEAAEARRSIRTYEPTPIPRADLLGNPARHQHRAVAVERAAVALRDRRRCRDEVAVAGRGVRAEAGRRGTGRDRDVLGHDGCAGDHRGAIHPGMPDHAKVAADIRRTFAGMSDTDRHAWGFAEANIALGYLLLTAQAHGYSTSPMLGFVPDKVKEILQLPSDARIPAMIAIGVAAEEGFPHHRHAVERVTRFV